MKKTQSSSASTAFLVSIMLLTGCGPAPPEESSGSMGSTVSVAQPQTRPTAEEIKDAELAILFFGNSHTGMHDVPGIVRGLWELAHGKDDYKCFTTSRSGVTLKDISASEQNHTLIRNYEWDVIVLQGQEISSSGRFTYPLDPAIDLTNTATESGKRVFLFAEWARDGIDERERFENVYREIATKCDATVVPIGRAFELAAEERPDLVLHANDGNHSSPAGAYLAACMLYGALAGEKLTDIENADKQQLPSPVPAKDCRFLREIADKALAAEAERDSAG